jgi:ribosome-associated protein
LIRKKSGAKAPTSHKSRRAPTPERARKRADKSATKPATKAAAAAARRHQSRATDTAPDVVLRPRVDAKRHQASQGAGEAAIAAALDKKALLPVLLDVSGRATYTDFIGIVSGRSDRQVDAIAQNVVHAMAERGWQLLGREGNGNGRWTLLDFGDVVLHVFYHPVREFYDIESLWIDAPRVSLKVPPEATQFREEALFYDRP